MMVSLLFIIGLMGLFFYNKIGSIITTVILPTTEIIEPVIMASVFLAEKNKKRVWDNSPFATKKQRICRCFLHGCDSLAKIELLKKKHLERLSHAHSL